MAEVLGVVSAGVGVAAAAGQLIDGIMKLYRFCSQIRNIPDDIQAAVDDLSTMVEVLEFVQMEMGRESFSLQSSKRSCSTKVLSLLVLSSQQVGEVLEEMRVTLGNKKYWGRVKAIKMTRELEKAAKRVEKAQGIFSLWLTLENRMMVQQNFNAQRRELTAISTRIFSSSSGGQLTGKRSRETRAIDGTENPNTSDEDLHTAGRSSPPIQTPSKPRHRKTGSMKLKLPYSLLSQVWELSVYKANQGWDFNLRSYTIRPRDAPIFQAIRHGDLSQVCDLLHSGTASIWDRDPGGWGVLHFAANSCKHHGSKVLEYLVQSGADIYDVDSMGKPPYYQFHHSFLPLDEESDVRLTAGYKVFTSHRDWMPSYPRAHLPIENGKFTSDVFATFPLFRSPPEETIRSLLHEMWPPWKDMLPADRIKTLFPNFGSSIPVMSLSSLRACLSREDIQKIFADWDTREKVELMRYAFTALAERSAFGLEKEMEATRLFLSDMHMTGDLMKMSSFVPLLDFVQHYVSGLCFRPRPLIIAKDIGDIQEGLNCYISELMLLGINMATIIDVERKVAAMHVEKGILRRGIWYRDQWCRVMAITYGPKADDWRIWLSNPRDEWAGEFWDMIDHPERAMPGAWEEDSSEDDF